MNLFDMLSSLHRVHISVHMRININIIKMVYMPKKEENLESRKFYALTSCSAINKKMCLYLGVA